MSVPLAILDSFAVLAYFRGEKSGMTIRDLLDKAATTELPLQMSEVNYAEVKYILIRKDGTAAWEKAREILEGLPIEFPSTNRLLAECAGDFKARFRISLADAFAASLARQAKAELVTGDPEFQALEKEIKIRWLG